MNSGRATVLAFDVGSRRIGVAAARAGLKIASPLMTIPVDGDEMEIIGKLIQSEQAHICVVGLPRNQSGAETPQSEFTKQFAHKIEKLGVKVVFQDESLTSVRARDELDGTNYTKGDIDKLAATYILQDYLEGLA